MTAPTGRSISLAANGPTDASDWRTRGRCATADDAELWFPVGSTGRHLIQAEQAKAECRRCPVQETCMAWALETRQEHGVWGALDEDERRGLLRRPERSPAAVVADGAAAERIALERGRDLLRWRREKRPLRNIARGLGTTQAVVRMAYRHLGVTRPELPGVRSRGRGDLAVAA